MLEPVGSGPRALLRIGGASLVQHQLGVAIALNCQRVICVARGASAEVLAMKRVVEAKGLSFGLVTGAQQLSGVVTAADELIVIAEGLFVDTPNAAAQIDKAGPVVLALPDDAVAEGFERLDINRASAGLFRIPGSLVERLHELPSDCDTVSALTRIALQAGVPLRQVPAEVRVMGWKLVRDEVEALAAENEWLRTRFAAKDALGPGRRLARAGVLVFGPSLLHAGNASNMLGVGSVAILALALGAAGFGMVIPALVLVILAWLAVQGAALLRGAERQAYGVAAPAIQRTEVLAWLVDAALIGIVMMGMAAPPGQPPIGVEARLFPAVMLVLLVHIVSRLLTGRLAAWTGDRAVLALVLALADAVGYLGAAVRLLAVAVAVVGLVLPARRPD